MESQFEIFINEDVAGDCVTVLLRGASIVEDENGELTPLLGMTTDAARDMARALVECADKICEDR